MAELFLSQKRIIIDGWHCQNEVIEGGYGYKGKTIEVYDDPNAFNSGGTPGSGAILSLKEDGINLLEEIKSDAIIIINPGSGFIFPSENLPDPAYPAPLQEAKAVAYLSNPDGDVYYVDVDDLTGANTIKSYSKRISVSTSSTGEIL